MELAKKLDALEGLEKAATPINWTFDKTSEIISGPETGSCPDGCCNYNPMIAQGLGKSDGLLSIAFRNSAPEWIALGRAAEQIKKVTTVGWEYKNGRISFDNDLFFSAKRGLDAALSALAAVLPVPGSGE